MRVSLLCLALCAATAFVAPRGAAAEWPPESLVNIQALPTDISVRELRTMMRSFAGALGVRCTHCHVGDDPDDLESIDFVADDKIEKRKAREMIRMVRRINEDLLARIPERSDPPVVVTCMTCHHSVVRPVDIRDLLQDTLAAQGVDAAIDRYKELREAHFGSDSYDFRHFMLANVAERVARANPQGALQLLEFNAELHPKSGQTFFTMAQIYRSLDDIDSTIRSLERAISADPESEFYRRALEKAKEARLEGG